MPKTQLHKRFTTEQVKVILQWYEEKALTLADARERLEVSEQRFFQLLHAWRKDTSAFSISYPRRRAHNELPEDVDTIIREELEKDKKLIENPAMPVRQYNYAAVRDAVSRRFGTSVSAQTVRRRAREWGFATPKPPPRRHDRIVLTTAPGMLLQHDASRHLWTPYTTEHWSLITTLDDFSRKLLYAELEERETAWAHISAAESIMLTYGAGLAYYVDSLRTFRFVSHRESLWYRLVHSTDEVMTQWKRVIEVCGMKVWYATSPQAKGKIERPYRWLQDRIVRRCAKEDVHDIQGARVILRDEVTRYNDHQVHSTTKEVPSMRFDRAVREGASVFRPFKLPPPYQSTKDIFCLRETRKIDGYRRISWQKYVCEVPPHVPPGAAVELHIIPDKENPELRVWFKDRVVLVVKFKPRA